MKFKRYLPYLILLVIIAIAGFLRLWRIGDYMGFLGDEGRDVLIVKRMIVDHKWTLLGPITSVGLMHLGPIYYYFMIPFLWIFRLDPVGPAVMVALFSLATVVLIWKMMREFFNEMAAVIASLLYSLSPLVIIYSHSSWNPNPLPFWSLLFIYGLIKVFVQNKPKWLIVSGIALGVVLQLHYVALVFVPMFVVLWLIFKPKISRKDLLLGLTAFVLVLSPFIIFELRHQFINSQTVIQFVTRSGTNKTFGIEAPLHKFWDLTVRLFWRLVIVKDAELAMLFLLILFSASSIYVSRWKPENIGRKVLIVLLTWYMVGVGLLSFYAGSIYDYYLMFAFPLPFILTGAIFTQFAKNTLSKTIVLMVVVTIAIFQIRETPILKPPNRLAFQTKTIADFILSNAGGSPYNFALIAGKNSDHAYRYFLEVDGPAPIEIKNPTEDPERITVTDQLFIVCEEYECKPLGHPLWEIAGFGRAEIANEWQVGLFRVFKLVPYQNL